MEPQNEYQEIVSDPDMTEQQQSEEKQDASTKEESNQ